VRGAPARRGGARPSPLHILPFPDIEFSFLGGAQPPAGGWRRLQCPLCPFRKWYYTDLRQRVLWITRGSFLCGPPPAFGRAAAHMLGAGGPARRAGRRPRAAPPRRGGAAKNLFSISEGFLIAKWYKKSLSLKMVQARSSHRIFLQNRLRARYRRDRALLLFVFLRCPNLRAAL
jgi:hypothetical protein